MTSPRTAGARSEEHTSELQSRRDLVCRLLLEKKKNIVYQRSCEIMVTARSRRFIRSRESQESVILCGPISMAMAILMPFFFFNDTATTEIYTLSLHDALPISPRVDEEVEVSLRIPEREPLRARRSEEHTSELQSRRDLVCRLLLEKKKRKYITYLQKKKKEDIN